MRKAVIQRASSRPRDSHSWRHSHTALFPFLSFEIVSCHGAQAALELTIILPRLPSAGDYRYVVQIKALKLQKFSELFKHVSDSVV